MLIACGVALTSTGCTQTTRSVSPKSDVSASPVDPLSDLAASDEFERFSGVEPVVHERGRGAATFEVPRPPGDAEEVSFFVACAPASTFTVTLGTFFSGPCGRHFENSGSIPLPAGDAPLRIAIDVPKTTRYWLVGVPTSAIP
jgi:hypothetical protein